MSAGVQSAAVGPTGRFATALEALTAAGVSAHAGGRLADVGCGSGEVAEAMALRGFAVTAVDGDPVLVDATRDRCLGLPVIAVLQDPQALDLPVAGFEVVHSSWLLHRLADAEHAVRAMARAAAPGGLVVLQYSHGQPRTAGFALGDVVESVAARPPWRDRLPAAPVAATHHPLEEVSALLIAEGLEVLHTETAVSMSGGEHPAAALAVRTGGLGEDATAFLGECVRALRAADALDPHHVRLVARRRLPGGGAARDRVSPSGPRGRQG